MIRSLPAAERVGESIKGDQGMGLGLGGGVRAEERRRLELRAAVPKAEMGSRLAAGM